MSKSSPYHKLPAAQQAAQRKQAVEELKKGASAAELARRFNVSRQALYQWLERHAADPKKGLEQRQTGRPSALSPEQLDKLKSILKGSPRAQGIAADAWTLERIRAVVKKNFKVNYAERSLWYVLKNRLGFSPARESKPKAAKPAAKKGGAKKAKKAGKKK